MLLHVLYYFLFCVLLLAPDQASLITGTPAEVPKTTRKQPLYLRGQPLDYHNRHVIQETLHPVELKPRSFSVDGLLGWNSTVSMATEWLLQLEVVGEDVVPESLEEAGEMLAYAVTALDMPALKYLLFDVGVPGNAANSHDSDKNAFLALGSAGMLAEGHQKSLIYSLLRGDRSWLSDAFDPPLPDKIQSVHSADILNSLRPLIRGAIGWLDAAGCDPLATDKFGGTLLHYSVNSGMIDLVEYAISHNVPVNAPNKEQRTALHIAAALGRAEILRLLMDAGGDLSMRDMFNVSVMDIIANPGPIQRADASSILGIEQRLPRQINRLIDPEMHPDQGAQGWPSTGGWG